MASVSDKKHSKGADGQRNGPGAMRKFIDSSRHGKTPMTLISTSWKSGHAPVAESSAWSPLKLLPSDALLRATFIMEQVRLELAADSLKRFEFGPVIAAIDRYWLDLAPALLEESNGITSGDVLWLALSHLFCIDRNENKTIVKCHSQVLKKANALVQPYTSVEQYALAVLKSELRYRLSTFHSGKGLYIEIQKEPPPPPPDLKKLMLQIRASETGVDVLAPSSSSSSASAQQKPVAVEEPRLVTPLGKEVVGLFSNSELLAACSASVLQFNTEDSELVSLASRLYFATMITRLLQQLAPRTNIPDEVLVAEPALCKIIGVECEVTVDHVGASFRNFLLEMYVPACCYSRCITMRGPVYAKQKTAAKLQCTQKELYPTDHSLNNLLNKIGDWADMPPAEILKDPTSPLYDDFLMFYFGFVFEARCGVSFSDYLVVTEHAYSRMHRITGNTISRHPLVFYRPLIILYGDAVFVKNHREMYQCRTKREACALWAHLVMTKHEGKLENGKCVKEFCSFAVTEQEEERESRQRLERYSSDVQKSKAASALDFKSFSER